MSRDRFLYVKRKGQKPRLVIKPRRRTVSHFLYNPKNGTRRDTLTKEPTMHVHKTTGEQVHLLAQDQASNVTFRHADGNEETVHSSKFFADHRTPTSDELDAYQAELDARQAELDEQAEATTKAVGDELANDGDDKREGDAA